MPYALFAATPGDVVTDQAGNSVGGQQIAVWDAETGGAQVSDLRDPAGAVLPGVVTSYDGTGEWAKGRFPFQAPDDRSVYWAETGQGKRWAVFSVASLEQIATALSTAQQASIDSGEALTTANDALALAEQVEGATGGSTALASAIYVVTDPAFGTAADGTTDDAAAFQDSLNAAAGGMLIIPKGTYRIDSTLRLPARTTIVLLGTLITETGMPIFYNYTTAMATEGIPSYSGNSGIIIRGNGMIDMRGHLLTTADPHNVMTFVHCEDITVRDITIRNVRGYHAIEPHSVRNMLIDNVKFEGYILGGASFPREAIQIDGVNISFDDDTPCMDITIRKCRFSASPIAGECAGWGRAVGSHTVNPTTYHTGIVVEDCNIYETSEYGVNPYAWRYSAVRNNKFRNIGGTAIYVLSADGRSCKDVEVSGNTIDTTVSGNGIMFGMAADAATFSLDCEVTNNRIYDSASNGINISGLGGGTIAGNLVNGTASNYCFQIGGAAVGTTATQLNVHGNIARASFNGTGFRLNGCTNTYFHGNKTSTTTGVNNSAGAGTNLRNNDYNGTFTATG